MGWKTCCDKPDRVFNLTEIYQSVSVVVGKEIRDIRENWSEVEVVFKDGSKLCIWGDHVSCKYIGDKNGKILDVSVSRRGVVIIHTTGAVWIKVEGIRETYLRNTKGKKLYQWRRW